MKKLSILFSTLLLLALGFSSCSDDLAQPPIIIPEGGLGTGSWTDPYTATQILGGSSGKEKWVTGYIVGWIDTKGGTNNTLSAETCTFTVPATLASNILIAADPDEKNFENCIPVQLPSGEVRTALNLMDHPENLGKQVTVKANVEKYFGKNEALKNLTAYNWGDKGIDDGGDKPDQPGGGNGTADTPYKVSQLLGGASGSDVWVTGFIVGWIQSNTSGGASALTAESAKFTAEGAQPSNLMIAESPDEKDYSKCTSVNLPSGAIRSALNLLDNPGNLGKEVSIQGNITKYFGVNGVKELKAYNWGPKGTSGGTTGTGETIYTGLVSDSNDWTFENINKPDGINDIWSWKVYNNAGYLNASAYVSGKPYASEALAISPEISLAGLKTASVAFDHASKFQTTLRQMCGIMVREAGATTWTTLSIPTWPEPGAWTFANSGAIDLSAYAGKKIQLAFKYGSSDEGADTWEIKNFKVSGTK